MRSAVAISAKDYFRRAPGAAAPEVPEGYEVRFTSRGVPFLAKKRTGPRGSSSSSASAGSSAGGDAINEHVVERVPMCTPMVEIGERFGVGIELYYDFIKFVMLTNLSLMLLGAIPTLYHFRKDGFRSERSFGVSTFTKKIFPVWLVTSLLSVVTFFSFGFAYARRITVFYRKHQMDDVDHVSKIGLDKIFENRKMTAQERRPRLVASYSIFILMLIVSAALNLGLVIGKQLAGRRAYALYVCGPHIRSVQ